MDVAGRDAGYWSRSAAEVAAALGGRPEVLSANEATAQLAAVGPNSVEDAPRPGALTLLLRQFGYLLIRVMVLIVLFVLTVNVALDRPVVESLLVAAALAVGLSPELLPAIISVTLSAGTGRWRSVASSCAGSTRSRISAA
jgi:magnesium-transporting ATPase (P-type)